MKESINTCVWGFEIEVKFYYHKGYNGSLTEPPEPEYIEITDITFLNTPGNLQALTSSFDEAELQESKEFLNAVESEIWGIFEYNKYNSYDDDEYRNGSYFDWEPEIEW